jgi:signal transduction histidine kinase
MSIGKRLSLLVLSELLTATIVVIAAVVSLGRLSEQAHYMHAYVFAPLVEIGDVALAGRDLQPGSAPVRSREAIGRLRVFIDRYRREWEVADSSLPEAVRFRGLLEHRGRLALLNQEREAVDAFLASVRRLERSADLADGRAALDAPPQGGDIADLRDALVRLNLVNLRYMEVGYDSYADSIRSLTMLFVFIGLASMIAAPLIGLSVRRAIAPRVAVLVEKVKRFRELGVNEPLGHWGGDELAVLAHALDASFAAISARDKDRARFLAVAAHELKTPLTTLKGFAQAAQAHRDDAALRDRALAVIDRQATRLARLVQDLLAAARVDGGQLSFQPGPLDLEALTRRVIAEVELVSEGHSFPLQVRGQPHILGDAWLLEQSLSGLLVQAATMVPGGAPVPVELDATGASVLLTIEARDVDTPEGDLDTLMEPFAVLQFERRDHGALRGTGIGLHLAHEIAALHAGSLRIERRSAGLIVFVLEFRH